MSAEHGSLQSGGLRREHIVAAVMVAAVTIVLGYASGFGIRQADAAADLPANPGGQPGGQQAAPPSAAAPPTGAARPTGSPVGLRPGVPAASGSGSGSGFASGSGFGAGSEFGNFDFGEFPIFPPGSAGDPAMPPAGPGESAPECSPGLLDSLLALLTEVLGGTAPPQAMSDAGIVILEPIESDAESGSPRAGIGTVVPTSAVDVPVLLPVGDGTVLVVGLIPLLDAVSQWELAHRQGDRPADPLTPLAAQPAPAPAADVPTAAAPGDQLSRLAALLAPVGLYADPGTGVVDPLLAPVLGSLGCGGITPATAPGGVQ